MADGEEQWFWVRSTQNIEWILHLRSDDKLIQFIDQIYFIFGHRKLISWDVQVYEPPDKNSQDTVDQTK